MLDGDGHGDTSKPYGERRDEGETERIGYAMEGKIEREREREIYTAPLAYSLF